MQGIVFFINSSISRYLLLPSCWCVLWNKCFERNPYFIPVISIRTNIFLNLLYWCFFFILWVFHILLYERNLLTPNLSGGMFYKGYLWSNLYDAIFSCTNCFDKVRAKSQCTWHLYKQGLYKVIKFTTFSSNSTQNKQKTQKSQKHEKLDLQKIE